MKKIYLMVFVMVSFLTLEANAQAVGDYGSGTSGNWGSSSTWVVCKTAGQWSDATAATGTPGASVSVYIRNGHTVTLDASGKNCKNLIIENGGLFKGNATQPTSSNVYVRLSGNLTNNGSFGASLVDNICIECSTNVVLQGTGSYKICRIRPASNISNITITFDADAAISYMGSSGSGGAGLMTLNSNNDNITYIINAGKTVTLSDLCNFATSSSTATSANLNSSFIINGSVVMLGGSGHLNLRTAAGKTCNFTVGSTGSFAIGRNLYVAQTGDTTANIVVDGILTAGTGNFDLSNSKQIITGKGTLAIPAASTLSVGSDYGVDKTSGQLQVSTLQLDPGAYYSFAGVNPQVTGSAIPATVGRLLINNAAGVTLNKDLTVTDTMFINAGILKLGGKVLTIAASGGINIAYPDATRMVVLDNASAQLVKAFSADGSFVFPVGDVTGTPEYSPVAFYITASAYSNAKVGVKLQNIKHPNNTSKADFLNRYWTLSGTGFTSPSYIADFKFAPGDVSGNKANIFALRYSSGKWLQ